MLCLQVAKLRHLDWKRLLVGIFAKSRNSMLVLEKVKNVVAKTPIYVNFIQISLVFFKKMGEFCTNWDFAF